MQLVITRLAASSSHMHVTSTHIRHSRELFHGNSPRTSCRSRLLSMVGSSAEQNGGKNIPRLNLKCLRLNRDSLREMLQREQAQGAKVIQTEGVEVDQPQRQQLVWDAAACNNNATIRTLDFPMNRKWAIWRQSCPVRQPDATELLG